MKRTRLIFLTIVFILLLNTTIYSQSIKNKLDYNIYDEANVLSTESKDYIKKTSYDLKKKTGGEIAVVILENIEEGYAKEKATEIFNEIKIGDEDLDNGVLILMAVSSRDIQIEPGYGTEGFITDAHSARIYRKMAEVIKSNNDDYEAGILEGYKDIVELYEKEYNVDIIEREPQEYEEYEDESDLPVVAIIILLLFLFSTINGGGSGGRGRRRRNNTIFWGPGSFGGFGGSSGGFGSGGGFGGFGGGGSSGGGGAGGKF